MSGAQIEIAAALVHARSVSSGGFCPKYDGRYKIGRAIKLLAAAGYLEEVGWRYRWTDAGHALLAATPPSPDPHQ